MSSRSSSAGSGAGAGAGLPALHLVRARLDAPPHPRAELRAVLSDAERARAARFRFERHRRRFEVATGLLRTAIGALMGRPPDRVVFEVGAHGKPYVVGGPAFNQSHSGEWWLLGWSDQGRVGVDVEVHRALNDLPAMARHTFHPSEAEAVLSVRGESRRRAFFRVWTRKEAFIKALGLGLAYPLDRFVVDHEVEPGSVLLVVDDPGESTAGWSLRSVGWTEGLSAAVAWDRPEGRLRWRALPVPNA